jgi:hypothetical protein
VGSEGLTMSEPLWRGLPPIDPATASGFASCPLASRFESVRIARQFATATLRRWGRPELLDEVPLVVSELVTNALRHALPDSLPALADLDGLGLADGDALPDLGERGPVGEGGGSVGRRGVPGEPGGSVGELGVRGESGGSVGELAVLGERGGSMSELGGPTAPFDAGPSGGPRGAGILTALPGPGPLPSSGSPPADHEAPVVLDLMRWTSRLVCAVRDPSGKGPVSRRPEGGDASFEESGRGLRLVESFSDGWGWHPLPEVAGMSKPAALGLASGKVVWALFRLSRR